MIQLQIIEQNGRFFADSREVAEMTGKQHGHLLRDIDGYIKILTESNFGVSEFFIESTYQDSTGRTLKRHLLTRKGCDMVANKMTGEKGVLFTAAYVTKFEEMERQIRNPYFVDQSFDKPILHLRLEQEQLKFTVEFLRLSDAGRLNMLHEFHKALGLSAAYLPVRVNERVGKSPTELLKKFDIPITAAEFNRQMMKEGFLEERERPSSKGGTKKYKAITEKCKPYGTNEKNMMNPRETQPVYFEDTFLELLRVIGVLGGVEEVAATSEN